MQFLRAAQKDPTMIKVGCRWMSPITCSCNEVSNVSKIDSCIVVPQAPWLLMIETDYVWMKPLQAPPAENPSSRPMAYPFNYIVPSAPALEGVMRKMYPAELGPLSNVHGTGPAPVMMHFDEWLEVKANAPSFPVPSTLTMGEKLAYNVQEPFSNPCLSQSLL